ncbi:hypothetical protein HMPREF1094_00219 [[Clostridium] innocuum 2959]|uniref:Phage minor capsid protein 2 n=1 Tax=[Clostridium] innocuum 2959 TaxID=999413 RepID=N9WVZ2_CLOIN|nr:phage minor capsid protein [[Clostridium] innocuum]ENY87768.1 hypothetical protein HMPREF1094_00219 [[Clostridium] innocuum 2959]
MLDPKYLRDVPEGIAEYFDELETRILKDIARRISQNDYMMTSTAEYQMHKLEELGVSMLEIEQAISEVLNITDTKVKEIIHDSSYRSVQKDNDMAKAADVEPPHPDLTQAILNGIRSTNAELRNICNSMASAANMAFEHALDQAYLSVSSGAFSFADAVKTAVNDLGKNGIRWIDYPTGAHRRADSAIRNALRTGVNQTAARCQEQNLDEMDCNLVETTSHMGARPEHAKWQGMLFWRKTPVNGLQNFYEATGYGTGAGLCGWNCRHNFFPNFDGELSFEHYDEEANAKQYELDQEQRYNERKIREWKRRQAVNKAGGVDNTREAKKVREWQKRQADFLKKYPDMKRNYARESISNRKVMLGSSAGGKANNAAGILIEKIDMKHVDNYIHKYENEIKDLPVEHSYVLQADGKVFHYTGDKKSVRFDEANLKDAIILHNHPILEDVETNSFENDDFWFLQNYGLVIDKLRATYGNLRYEVKVLKDISSIDYDSYMYGDIGTALMYGEIEGDIHELIFKQLDKEGYIKYVKSKAK